MAGITAQGLEIKDLTQVLVDYNNTAAQVFADLVPAGDTVDTGPNSALGRLIGVVAPADEALWEVLQMVYNSFNPEAATGIALDNLVGLSAIYRYDEMPTRAQVILQGTIDSIVSSPPAKFQSSSTGRVFSLVQGVQLNPKACSGIGIFPQVVQDNTKYQINIYIDDINTRPIEFTSPASGTTQDTIYAGLKAAVDANFNNNLTTYQEDGRLFIVSKDPFSTNTFEEGQNLTIQKVLKPALVADDVPGPIPQQTLSIDTITIPVVGLDSVTQPVPAVTGRLRETDAELRERFRNSKFVTASNILEAMLDSLGALQGVTDVIIIENDTDSFDSVHGVPAHSFMPIVLGGLPTEIGNTIWLKKPTGIGSVGDTQIQIVDSIGHVHLIKYKRPTEVPIAVEVSVQSTGSMPGDIELLLKQSISKYGEDQYKIGDDVIYSRFYTPINAIQGFQVNSLTIGKKGGTQGMVNVPIKFDEVATFSMADVKVNLVP